MASIRIGNGKNGVSIQTEGDIEVVNFVGPTSGPVNTGSGTQNNVTVVHDRTDVTPGATYVAGDNTGGISRSF